MGRPVGIPNKASGVIKELAQQYGPAAIQKLGDLAGLGEPAGIAESQTTQVLALRELLDRGYGKATQPLSGEAGRPIEMIVHTGVRRNGDTLRIDDQDRG